ncbi:MAG: hypothetical protein Q6363_006725 [Candidatus Njordarchaeota archaeon]
MRLREEYLRFFINEPIEVAARIAEKEKNRSNIRDNNNIDTRIIH